MKCNIIGSGRLGKSLVHSLTKAQITDLQAVCNKSLNSAQNFIHEFGSGQAIERIEDLPFAEVFFLACTDDALDEVVSQLMLNQQLKSGCFIIHCSGVLSSEILAPLRAKGCLIASIHPLKAFSLVSATAFEGVDIVIEGDEAVCAWLNTALTQLGAHILNINPENKALYHAGCCMMANYLVTLAHYAQQLFMQAGLSDKDSKSMIANLIQSDLDNLRQSETVEQTLTGPLMRGDVKTLNMHLQVIGDEKIRQLYAVLGINTLPLTKLSAPKQEEVKQVLAAPTRKPPIR